MVAISKWSSENPRYVNLLKRRGSIPAEVETTVRNVLRNVRERGDEALKEAVHKACDNLFRFHNVELLLDDYERALTQLTNAGAVFVGPYSTEPVGDYFCGTNHILPTCGTARFSSGMSAGEFMRGYSVIRYTEDALEDNGEHIIGLAESEGMRAHALAVKVRKGF